MHCLSSSLWPALCCLSSSTICGRKVHFRDRSQAEQPSEAAFWVPALQRPPARWLRGKRLKELSCPSGQDRGAHSLEAAPGRSWWKDALPCPARPVCGNAACRTWASSTGTGSLYLVVHSSSDGTELVLGGDSVKFLQGRQEITEALQEKGEDERVKGTWEGRNPARLWHGEALPTAAPDPAQRLTSVTRQVSWSSWYCRRSQKTCFHTLSWCCASRRTTAIIAATAPKTACLSCRGKRGEML